MDDLSGVEKGLMDWEWGFRGPHPLFEPFVVVTKEVHLHYFVKMNIAPLIFPDIAAMLTATRRFQDQGSLFCSIYFAFWLF